MPKQRKLLGCSFPVLIGVILVVLALFVVGFLAGPIGKGMFPGVHESLPSFLKIEQPRVELPAETAFEIFGFPIANSVIATWFTILVLGLLVILVTRRTRLVPRRWQMLVEFGLGALLGFCQRVAGEKNGRRFFPVVATIFLFVFANAWLSLLPGFGSITIVNPEGHEVHLLRGANTDINTPLAIALVSFVSVAFFGLSSLGIGWLKNYFNFGKFFGGFGQLLRGNIKGAFGGIFIGIIDIFIGLVELLSMFIRIVSFTFRLFGNMTAGEILLLMASFLVPFLFALPFYGLELLVGIIQALIFSGLTLVFMTLAVATHGAEHH
ncbi:MAG: ATP synthase F0 subunit A [Chloroflexi bacterium RBG_16_57_8]|nr:MAG: ATP synthase F0 subunit A [Chloroflexi bacterium RBG_16_57_8]